MRCTAAPKFEQQFPASSSPFAEEGTTAHEVCELYVNHTFCGMSKRSFNAALKKVQAKESYNPEMLETAQFYVNYITERANRFKRVHLIQAEVNVDLSRWIPEGKGQCDNTIIGDDTLHITDYKHGKGVPVSAEDNEQMRLYALGVFDSLSKPGGYYSQFPPAIYGRIKRVTMAIVQPRLNSVSEDEISVDDLLAWGETAREKAVTAYEGMGEFCPGEKQCKFCRAKSVCRARAMAQMELESAAGSVTPNNANGITDPDARKALGLPPVLTDAEVGDLLKRGEMLVEWYNDLRDYALEALLNGSDIPGYKAVEGRSARAFVNQEAAFAILESAGIPEEQLYKTEPRTLAELEKVVGKKRFAELVGAQVTKPRGKPTLADMADKREPYNSAAAEFGGVKDDGQ